MGVPVWHPAKDRARQGVGADRLGHAAKALQQVFDLGAERFVLLDDRGGLGRARLIVAIDATPDAGRFVRERREQKRVDPFQFPDDRRWDRSRIGCKDRGED